MAKTVILVGGTSGLGLLTARCMAQRGARVLVTGRNLSHLTPADQHAGIRGIHLDLGSLEAARAFAASPDLPDPDVLILNAGQQHVTERQWSSDGFEATMAVNVLAPLAVLDTLAPRLPSGGRVLWTSSGTHNPDEVRFARPLEDAPLEELVHPRAPFARGDGFRWYATSKLCVVRLVTELARALAAQQVRINAFDPGLMPGTGLARNYPPALRTAWTVLTPALLAAPGARRPSTSARNLTQLALAPEYAKMTGAYIADQQPARRSIASHDADAAHRLYTDACHLINAAHLRPLP